MSESAIQSAIIKHVRQAGGVVINGRYTATGTADLITGYNIGGTLRYCEIEVKTPEAYARIMQHTEIIDGLYRVQDISKLKGNEYLQIVKLNVTREKGGLAILTCSIAILEEYIYEIS